MRNIPAACLIALCLVACSTAPTDGSTASELAPLAMKPLPHGLFRVISYGRGAELQPNTSSFFATYPFVHGMAVVENWNVLEKTRGAALDTSYLDTAVGWAHEAHVPLVLLIQTGGPSQPGWLRGPRLSLADGATTVVPWDQDQNDSWLATSAKLAARYDNDDAVVGIYVAGVQAEYPEMFLERGPYRDQNATSPDSALVVPDGAVYTKAWIHVLEGMAQQWRRTWLLNMIDTIDYWDHPENDGYDQTMLAVASAINNDYARQATMGITNMGYSTVVAPPNGVIAPKYAAISADDNVAPIVYELGPLKQSGAAGEVRAALDYACTHIRPRIVITQPGTWRVDNTTVSYPTEMKNAVASCPEWQK